MTEQVHENEISLNGYNQLTSVSISTRTGGVIIYYKLEWKVTKLFEKVKNSKYWILACKAQHGQTQLIIVAIYRSPSGHESEFCEIFQQTLEDLSEEVCDIVVTGDFNIDWANNNFYRNKIERLLNDNGLRQIVKEFTRVTDTTRTIIDYVITNNKYKISAQNCKKNKISDHEIIQIFLKVEKNNNKEDKNISEDKFRYNKIMFTEQLKTVMKYEENVDVSQNVAVFDKCLEDTIRKFTSKTLVNRQNYVNKWFNNELHQIKQDKIIKYQIAKIENSVEAWANYKSIRNLYKVKIENEKFKYINNRIKNARDQKQMWREIKELVIKQNKNEIKCVIFNNVEYKEYYQIASHFNKYFVNSVKIIRDSIEHVQYTNKIHMVSSQFRFNEITNPELKKIVRELKNKPDFCKISTKILLDNWQLIAGNMLKIINKSLTSGVFPENWKESMVTPIEKVAKTRKCEEFRPINTLKTCEKILEKVVKDQIEKYFETHKLISKYQSGFRKKFSCETTVNYVINRWKNIEKNRKIMAIFLDFKRAFETIDREILIQKLYMYGIREKELAWFKSYLANRKQITKVNDIKSDSINNDFGVPQGSILGALLFIIYINDMPNILEQCQIILYADDTLIYTEGDSSEECHNNMVNDINNINIWLKKNKLKLNETKTKIMEINFDSEIVFKINNEGIEKVNNMKYLGFIIDKEMKFKDHIDYICKKISKKIGFFKRIRNKISLITSINVYNTIIKPHFEFGSTIIYTCCNESQIERLQILQNKAMRTILKCSKYANIQVMLDMLKWLNIKQRLQLNTLLFIYQIKHGNAPEYLCDQIKYVGEVQPYGLRNAENFRLRKANTTSRQRSLFYKGLKLFNSLPNETKTENNIKIFKKECVNFVKNSSNV